MNIAKVTLEQWRVFHAVIAYGGFAQAAEELNKSQSSISYAIAKIQDQLGVDLLSIKGRKAELTSAGEVLLRRSRLILEESEDLEKIASSLAGGREAEITIAVDAIFPIHLLICCLEKFSKTSPLTRIEIIESVLSGTEEALLSKKADLVIIGELPTGYTGIPLINQIFVAMAASSHPLHQLGREVTFEDLRQHRQIIIRDSGSKRKYSRSWQDAEQRWTFTNISSSIAAIRQGHGFARVPASFFEEDIKSGLVKPLPMRDVSPVSVDVKLVYSDKDHAGPATRELAAVIEDHFDNSVI